MKNSNTSVQLSSLTIDSDCMANKTLATEKKSEIFHIWWSCIGRRTEPPALERTLVMANWVEKVPSTELLLEQQNHQLGPKHRNTKSIISFRSIGSIKIKY